MKNCPDCKQRKNIDAFQRDRQQTSGLKPYCRNCMKIRSEKYYQANTNKVLLRNSNYRKIHKELYLKTQYTKRKLLRRIPLENNKFKARLAVFNAVKNGKVKKLSCEVCHNLKVEAHHYKGYVRVNWLAIIWLCNKHHVGVHHA